MSSDPYVTAVLTHLANIATVGRLNAAGAGLADWRYTSWAELILAEGRIFAPPVDEVPAEWAGAPTTCYVSASLWSRGEGLPYVEGWGATPGWFSSGTEHAWCLGRDGRVRDPVWPLGRGTAYIGIAFTAEFRRSLADPMVFDVHDTGLSLLREGVSPDFLVEAGTPIAAGQLPQALGLDDRPVH